MIEEFLSRISPEWTQIEFTAIKDWVAWQITKEQALNNKTANIYVLWGVDINLDITQVKRVSDDNITLKNYFCIDIDLRTNMWWTEVTNEEIKQEAINVINELNNIDYFNERAYLIFSWNWFHIYYIWDAIQISKEEYSLWVSRIFKKFDTLIWDPYTSDKMCKNIARILRLPWSVNQKNWAKVEILKQQNIKSRLVSNIKELAKAEQEEIDIINKQKQKEIEATLSKFSWDENKFYEAINKQIPAYQIAQLLIPEFPFDWKRNFKNNKWWFTWYYYVRETNSICNWGSRFFARWTESSCWSNFELIKRTKNFTNKETFAFFRAILNTNK